MAVKLLQVLVLGVIAAASADDVRVTWVPPPRATLPCLIPDARRLPPWRPPPPLEGERPRARPHRWTKDGVDFKSTNGNLTVSRRAESEAVYQCAVRHPAGLVLGYPTILKFAHLEKQFSLQPANATAWRGQPFVLSCNISSGPAANYSWLRDGEPLPDDARFHQVNNQLIITVVTYEDAGQYRCKATNSLANRSRISYPGHVTVEEAPEDLKTAFLQVQYDSALEVPRGGSAVLPCLVVGNPRPQMIWEWSPPGVRTGELEEVSDLLQLRGLEYDLQGLYSCRAEGHPHLTRTFNVTVTKAVNITHVPESRQVVRASTVRFNCSATGSPPPSISWYKDGAPIKVAGRVRVVPNADDKTLIQLLIRSVSSEDAGVYQCFARNSMSEASAWATLNVTGGEAAAPDDVRCWPSGADTVVLRWRPMTNVVAYTVQYTVPDGSSLPWQPVVVPETLINVKSPLTPYSFQIRAYIGAKNTATIVSDMSNSVTCQGQGVPISLSKSEDDSVVVSWQDFHVANPGVLEWILQQKAENSSDEHNVTLEAEVYNYTLKVSPSEPQQVRVLGTRSLPWLAQNLTLVPWTATSAAGHSLPPGEVRAVPEDVEVTEVNAHNFTVRWRCEKESMTYSYMVCTRKLGGNEDCVETYVKSAMIVNLEPNSNYEVRVQARLPGHMIGGDYSSPIQVTTPQEGQENIRNLTYKFVNETAVLVSWARPLSEGTVRYTYDYQLPMTQWTALEAKEDSVLLTGLDPTKKLFVRVEGRDPLDKSLVLSIPVHIPARVLTCPSQPTQSLARPTAGRRFSCEAKDLQYAYTETGLSVWWTGEGPRVVRYTQNLTQPLKTWPTVHVSRTTVLLTGLDSSLHTFVMVAAQGGSARSQVLTIKPRPAQPAGTKLFHEDNYNLYLGVSITCGVLILCALCVAAVFAWRKRKRARTPRRSARAPTGDEGGEEMANIGDRLANGGGSKDAGEPLLNGHVTHITENPSQSKTPNGKVRKGQHYEDAFDVTRYDADVTLETVLDPDTSTTSHHLLDTSRRPEYEPAGGQDISANDSFSKLPDDNMNSELTRGHAFELDNSKVLPTLQPNG